MARTPADAATHLPTAEPSASLGASRGHIEGDGSRLTEDPSCGDVRLLDGPFLEEDATRALRTHHGDVGAIVAFTGIVRADERDGAAVARLGFDAYPEMALHEMARIRLDAVHQFQLTGLTIWHRIDTMAVGAPIVLVAAAARHRADAFAAAAWAMDEVKRRVPVWKHETRTNGTTEWVHAGSCTCGADAGRR